MYLSDIFAGDDEKREMREMREMRERRKGSGSGLGCFS